MPALTQSLPAGAGRCIRGRALGRPVGHRSVTVCRGNGRFIVGGNWKCNGTRETVKALVEGLNKAPPSADVEVVCAPPFLYLEQVTSTLNKRYDVAGQNAWVDGLGAFTGEIAAEQLLDVGASWVILGHSERRALCGESNELVGRKVRRALDKGLKVILCVGETLAQREAGVTISVITEQLAAVSAVLSAADWARVVVAYEPVWAIGTGKVASPAQAQEVHAGIRAWADINVSPEVAAALRIQYGGSVNAANCAELAGQEDIDGFLVGGASLKAADFLTICASADAHYSAVKASAAATAAANPLANPLSFFGFGQKK